MKKFLLLSLLILGCKAHIDKSNTLLKEELSQTCELTWDMYYQKGDRTFEVKFIIHDFPKQISSKSDDRFPHLLWDLTPLNATIYHDGEEKPIVIQGGVESDPNPKWRFWSQGGEETSYRSDQVHTLRHSFIVRGRFSEFIGENGEHEKQLTTDEVTLIMQGLNDNSPEILREIAAKMKNNASFDGKEKRPFLQFPNYCGKKTNECGRYRCRWKTSGNDCGPAVGNRCNNDSCEIDREAECVLD